MKLGTRKRRDPAVAIDRGRSHDRRARRRVVDGSACERPVDAISSRRDNQDARGKQPLGDPFVNGCEWLARQTLASQAHRDDLGAEVSGPVDIVENLVVIAKACAGD